MREPVADYSVGSGSVLLVMLVFTALFLLFLCGENGAITPQDILRFVGL